MIAKIKRNRGNVLLILSKPALKSMGLKIGMKLHFHVEKEKLIAIPVTNSRVLLKSLKNLVRKTYSTKRASQIHKIRSI